MAIETATYITQLNPALPNGDSNTVSELDDTDRLIKQVLQNTLPNLNGPVNATPTELNKLVGCTATTTTLNYTTTPNTANMFARCDSTGKVPVANLPSASETAQGIVERATSAEVAALSDTTRYVVPAYLPTSSTSQRGMATLGANSEFTGLTGSTNVASLGAINTYMGSVRYETVTGSAASSMSTLAFENMSASFSKYRVVGSIYTSVSTELRMRVSTDSGVSWVSTNSYNYKNDAGTTTLGSYCGIYSATRANIDGAVNFDITVYTPRDTGYYTFYSGVIVTLDAAGALSNLTIGGRYVSTTAVDGIQFTPGSGTITGSFSVYGLR